MAVLSVFAYVLLRHFIFRCVSFFGAEPMGRRLGPFQGARPQIASHGNAAPVWTRVEAPGRGVAPAWGPEVPTYHAEDVCVACVKSLQHRCPRLDLASCDASCLNLADVSQDDAVCAPSPHLKCNNCDIEATCLDSCADQASQLSEEERIAQEMTDALVLFGVFFLQPCFASFYKYFVVDRKPRLTAPPLHDHFRSQGSSFRSAIYECLGDPHVCLHGFCCSATRVADTYSSASIWSFWANFFVVTLIYGVDAWTRWRADFGDKNGPQPLLIGSVVYAAFFAWRRGALRSSLGGDGCGPMDCVWLWCCPHLAAVQEARHLDDALGVHTSCCCELSTEGQSDISQPLVGMPVLAASTREVQLVEQASRFAETQPLAAQALRSSSEPVHFSGTAHRLDE